MFCILGKLFFRKKKLPKKGEATTKISKRRRKTIQVFLRRFGDEGTVAADATLLRDFANIHEATGDRGGGCHGRRNEMGASALALATLKVTVRR